MHPLILQDLPREIIIHIADVIPPDTAAEKLSPQYATLVHSRPKSFTSLSAVCRNLRDILLPHLFERVSFFLPYNKSRSAEDYNAAEKALDRYPHIALHVR